jgi:hypothetical protein
MRHDGGVVATDDRRIRGARFGAVAVGFLAAILTVVDAVVLLRYDVDAVWARLQVPVVVLAWVAPFAWQRQQWTKAGLCLLATLAGLWGYFYLPPLAALVLAGVALYRAGHPSPP